MTKKKSAQKKNEIIPFTSRIIIAAIIAFIAALCFRQSAGALAMTPIAFILCGIGAFLKMDWQIYFTTFGVTVFSINTIEQTDIKITLTFTTLCLLACLLFRIGKSVFCKSKKIGVSLICVFMVICIAASIVFIGNPFDAIDAKNTIENYTSGKYENNENAALGEFEFSNIYYNHNTKVYEVRASSSKYPTETGVISAKGNNVYDGFNSLMEEKICSPYIAEFTTILRKYFPDETFYVGYDSIKSKPDDKILSAAENELYGRIDFIIYIGGVQTANGMNEKVSQYMHVINSANLDYAEITFKSGISPWMQRSVTVDKNHPLGFENFDISHTHPETSEKFNRYVSYLLKHQ